MLANGPGIDVDSMEPGVGSGFSQPVMELIQQRFSSRSYQSRPISAEARGYLLDFLATLDTGPLGTPARFTLSAAAEQERDALRSLGTYGFIKNPTGFIIGVVRRDIKDLEDFGYLMERAVLVATGLGLSTCWLGGSFRRSSFAKKIDVQTHEVLPAVISAGYSTSPDGASDAVRRRVGGDSRLPWEALFFAERFGNPLTREAAAGYALPLEGVRLGPSASNKQPWRIVNNGDAWHFYVQRTPGYRNQLGARLLHVEDLQRVDMGIAMAHFELVAAELGLKGQWAVAEPALRKLDELTEYAVTWIGQ
jgi:hypothetical protein